MHLHSFLRPFTNFPRSVFDILCPKAGPLWLCCLLLFSIYFHKTDWTHQPQAPGGLLEPLWAPDRPMRSQRCGCRQCLAGWMAGVLCHFLGHGESRPRQMSKRMSVVWEEDQRKRPGIVGGPYLPVFVSLSPTLFFFRRCQHLILKS